MKKVKRYNEEGYVTSDDSNAGMKEARDAIDADIAKTPSADYGDYMPESSSQTMVAAPKPKPKTVSKANYSNEGRSRSTTLNKPNYSNEGRSTPLAKTEKLGDMASRMSRQADANRAAMEAAKPAPTPRKRNILEEAKENVRRSNAARSSMASGGMASSRADGIAQRGKTKGRMC